MSPQGKWWKLKSKTKADAFSIPPRVPISSAKALPCAEEGQNSANGSEGCSLGRGCRLLGTLCHLRAEAVLSAGAAPTKPQREKQELRVGQDWGGRRVGVDYTFWLSLISPSPAGAKFVQRKELRWVSGSGFAHPVPWEISSCHLRLCSWFPSRNGSYSGKTTAHIHAELGEVYSSSH